MCFSATASFTAATVIGSTGLLALSRATSVRELPLAGVPMLFALQQAIEGALWLTLPHGDHAALALWLANGFAFFALVLWPVYAPSAVLSVERLPSRRAIMALCLALGLAFALYSARDMALHPYHAVRAPASLCYINDSPYPLAAMAFYVPATCGAFLLSSHAALRLFGIVVAVGLAVALATFFADLVSVWCFFAAAASAILALHLLQPRDAVARLDGQQP